MVLPAAIGVLLVETLVPDRFPYEEIRTTCDQAAQALLTTRDPVELQRADMLIRHLDCSVSQRLPPLR